MSPPNLFSVFYNERIVDVDAYVFRVVECTVGKSYKIPFRLETLTGHR